MTTPLRIGFIPLVDAAALIVAVDKGFTAAEGLDVTLVREVSWSNVRDKLNIGLFDAAHLLAPVAIASSLGLGHVKVPIAAPFNLGLNGNAITVSPALHTAFMAERTAEAVFRPDLYDSALGREGKGADAPEPIGAFAGPAFDANDIAAHLAAFKIGRSKP
jgi:NitT/TauT family transport system ATP-binding protein